VRGCTVQYGSMSDVPVCDKPGDRRVVGGAHAPPREEGSGRFELMTRGREMCPVGREESADYLTNAKPRNP